MEAKNNAAQCFTCEQAFKDDDMVIDLGPHTVHATVFCCWSGYRNKVLNFRYSHKEARRFSPQKTLLGKVKNLFAKLTGGAAC